MLQPGKEEEMSNKSDYGVIGKRTPRVDARAKATGEALYAADISMPGMLWCKMLRSPYPHARILNIDTSRAEKLPGVKAVCVGKDFGGFKWGLLPWTTDESPLAVDKVRYMAEAVAAVAAVDEDTAEEATELIKVEYEELPGVFDPEEAMKDGVPQVHDYVMNNLSADFHMDFGDVEKAFSESDLVREERFENGRVTHGYLEPPAAVALWDSSGITIWPAKQSPYFSYRHMAACFKLPLNKVRVVQPFIGGGFGGTKNDSLAGDFCSVLLSKWTGRPVKFVYTMEEVLATCRRRHNSITYVKMGMKKDGTLTAVQTRLIADGGAYTAVSPITMMLTGIIGALPYKLPNYKHDAYAIFTNNPISAAMRGHGVTHTRPPCEIMMEMMAEELGIGPKEIRLKNAIIAPHETVNKIKLDTHGTVATIEAVTETEAWKNRGKEKKTGDYTAEGVGLASVSYMGGGSITGHQSCGAIVRICEDGTVNYLTGATDAGQGSDTVLVQMVAEELGLGVEDIDIKRVDTAVTPCDAGTYASRVTILAGEAAQNAARDARAQMAEILARKWEANPEDIVFKDKKVFPAGSPATGIPFYKAAKLACYSGSGAVILGRGHSKHGSHEDMDMKTGTGTPGANFSCTSQVTHLKVDLETGVVRFLGSTVAHDCGVPLNPMIVEQQNEGAAVQGFGQALYEKFVMDKGRTLNPTMTDYKMPLSTDVPLVKVKHIITNDPNGPYGAKEASEGAIVSAPPSVISAIHDATGVWIKRLPITPEDIVRALKGK